MNYIITASISAFLGFILAIGVTTPAPPTPTPWMSSDKTLTLDTKIAEALLDYCEPLNRWLITYPEEGVKGTFTCLEENDVENEP